MPNSKPKLKTIEQYIQVPGGKIWSIKYYTNLSAKKIPLVMIHGGPGISHGTLIILKQLAIHQPVIFYDQLGCGKSDHPDDNSLWKLPRFVKELQCLISQFNLEKIHLLGHSWGAALATEFALMNPSALLSLILSSPLLSTKKWVQDANQLRSSLPHDIQIILKKHEKQHTTDSKEYEEATLFFYKKHICRLQPWPEELVYAFSHLNAAIYQTMWGKTEFYMTGNLKNFDRTNDLSKITCPTLITCGKYDEATPETMRYCLSKLQNGSLEIFQKSSHTAMWEEEEKYRDVIQKFIDEVIF